MPRIAAGLLATAILSCPQGASAAESKVIEIRAYLFLEHSGKLSGNLVGSGKALYNTGIGEGDAGEPASQVLIDVVFSGSTEKPDDKIITVTHSGLGGKPVVQKQRIENVLFEPKGTAHGAMLIDDAGCGTMKIVAETGKSRKSAELKFTCGE